MLSSQSVRCKLNYILIRYAQCAESSILLCIHVGLSCRTNVPLKIDVLPIVRTSASDNRTNERRKRMSRRAHEAQIIAAVKQVASGRPCLPSWLSPFFP